MCATEHHLSIIMVIDKAPATAGGAHRLKIVIIIGAELLARTLQVIYYVLLIVVQNIVAPCIFVIVKLLVIVTQLYLPLVEISHGLDRHEAFLFGSCIELLL
jgi:hypothetical protein